MAVLESNGRNLKTAGETAAEEIQSRLMGANLASKLIIRSLPQWICVACDPRLLA
jgi:hypothetical protein